MIIISGSCLLRQYDIILMISDDIQIFLNRRRPGYSQFSTPRQESDQVEILSGLFERKTTGTPISLIVKNTSQRSGDYGDIATYYRPGHADYTFDAKYGFRDYRGGGRSSGRETIGRVAAGAIASKILSSLGISFTTYVSAIGDITANPADFDAAFLSKNDLNMPDKKAMMLQLPILKISWQKTIPSVRL